MFNFAAEQIFVLHPRSAGGGILAFLLSLDTHTSTLDFKKTPLNKKIAQWQNFIAGDPNDAHLVGFVHVSHPAHLNNITTADHCDRYIHKNQFYELDGLCEHSPRLLPQMTGEKKSVGIYLTPQCVSKIIELRPQTPPIDFYQMWVYSNQKQFLQQFYDISSVHCFSFSEMLDQDQFLDHVKYCKDILSLDIDLDTARTIITQWYKIIKLH